MSKSLLTVTIGLSRLRRETGSAGHNLDRVAQG